MKVNYLKATFRDGREVIYTTAILALLLTDNDVTEIIDLQTGEVLKAKY